LIFSTPDDSDPRTNGRIYEVKLEAGISERIQRQLADLGGLLLLVSAALGAWTWRRGILDSIGALVRHLADRRRDYLLAALAPASLSLSALIWLPPLWNGSDSSIWLLWQLSWIPHHPPLYPAFMAALNELTGNAMAMLRSAQWLQHLALVLAVTYLASAYRRAWQILTVSILAYLSAGVGLFAHGFFTEALAIPLLLIFLGALLRLHRDGLTISVAAALALSLLAASLTRHALLILGGLPIAYVLVRALLSRGRSMRLSLTLQVVALTMGIVVVSSGVSRYVALILDAQEISILGRAGVYRIQAAYALVPARERADWLMAMAEQTTDPGVQAIFPLLAETANPWTGPRDAILTTPEVFGRHPDELMNTAFKTFAASFDHYVLQQWGREVQNAVLGTGSADYCPGQLSCLLTGTINSIERVFPSDARTFAAVAGTGADQLTSVALYHYLANQRLTGGLDGLLPLRPEKRGLFMGASLLLSLIAVGLRRTAADTALILSLWLGTVAYVLALTWVTVVLPRYLSPIDTLVWLSNAVALIVIGEHLLTRSRERYAAQHESR
jgi:hypothetical protein